VIADADDLVRALRAAESKVTLTVRRKNATRTIESELRVNPRVMRMGRGAPYAWRDGDVRIRVDDDVRRELEDLRREIRDLKTKLEGRN